MIDTIRRLCYNLDIVKGRTMKTITKLTIILLAIMLTASAMPA